MRRMAASAALRVCDKDEDCICDVRVFYGMTSFSWNVFSLKIKGFGISLDGQANWIDDTFCHLPNGLSQYGTPALLALSKFQNGDVCQVLAQEAAENHC